MKKELEAARLDYEHVVNQLMEANHRIKYLEEIVNKPIKNESNHEFVESLSHEISSLAIEHKVLSEKIKEQDEEINDLQNKIIPA